MKNFLAFFFLVPIIISNAYAQTNYWKWYFSKSLVKNGQALVIHGLNTQPEKMQEIISNLNQRGHDVLLLKLLGHNDDLKLMKTVTHEEWEKQIVDAFQKVRERNILHGGKITLTGYSLGGALAMSMLSHNSQIRVDQVILFAPALSIKKTSYLVLAMGVFGDSFVVPSFSPKEYRAQSGTTVAAYGALFETVKKFETGDKSLINIPTLVFIDKNDELVSYKGIYSIAKHLDQWQLVTVDNKHSTLKRPYHHLIIDKRSLGNAEWNNVVIPHFDKILGPVL